MFLWGFGIRLNAYGPASGGRVLVLNTCSGWERGCFSITVYRGVPSGARCTLYVIGGNREDVSFAGRIVYVDKLLFVYTFNY